LSDFVEQVRSLIRAGDVRISEHGYNELAEDGLTAREVLGSVEDAVVVEEYPKFAKGRCVLLLQKDRTGKPIHVVWGIPKVVTDPRFWSLPIARTRRAGTRHSRGDGNDDTAKEVKVRA